MDSAAVSDGSDKLAAFGHGAAGRVSGLRANAAAGRTYAVALIFCRQGGRLS